MSKERPFLAGPRGPEPGPELCTERDCGGHLTAGHTIRLMPHEGRPFVVDGVPALICDTCGAVTLAEMIARSLA